MSKHLSGLDAAVAVLETMSNAANTAATSPHVIAAVTAKTATLTRAIAGANQQLRAYHEAVEALRAAAPNDFNYLRLGR